jgi:hypothetical protein
MNIFLLEFWDKMFYNGNIETQNIKNKNQLDKYLSEANLNNNFNNINKLEKMYLYSNIYLSTTLLFSEYWNGWCDNTYI